ncbi:ABC transporter substrate-binding protein [Xanthobacter dioxanivorans]|uniref:ABC transporter substrate-binding protein n=1 Tax=Xanthobacter dioxanivorans TaxID=2528964 RepID=A0A974PSM1_9HYPH|nr:ABC transporter substrate-binding protein [Xanthobacter dioxanivorans]QRG08629.1 ABC transporter substrate-binding protein [Xanthobacter dioxanivorans]
MNSSTGHARAWWPGVRRRTVGAPPRRGGAAFASLGLAAFLALCGGSAAWAVKIGVLTDMSGVIGDAAGQGSVVAAELAVEDMGGPVLGKPVEIVSADHQFKPDLAATITRRWFDVEGVDAVADLTVSPIALAAQQIGRDKNKIILIAGSGTQALFGTNCTSTSFVWMFDTALQTRAAVQAAAEPGAKWFLISPAYTYGIEMETLMRKQIEAQGGTVIGATRMPVGTMDYGSVITSAQASGATYIGFAQAGHDAIRLVQQAHDFGVARGGQKLVAQFLFITDVNSMDRKAVDDLLIPTPFYWNTNDATRAFSKRFFERMKRPPTLIQAGVYSSVLHYLKAVKAAGTVDATAVAAAMRAMRVNDATIVDGLIREDGRLMRDMYLMRIKPAEKVKVAWDYFEVVKAIPLDPAQRSTSNPACTRH